MLPKFYYKLTRYVFYLKLLAYFRKLHPKKLLLIFLGSLFSAVAINLFLVPHKMLSGGLSGIAMILYFLFKTPIGLMVSLMNIPLLYLAYKYLSKPFLWKTILGLILFSFLLDVTNFLTIYVPTSDIFLASIYGGVLSGIGSGLVFKADGSSGGTDIIAAIIKKLYSMEMGMVGFLVNVVIVSGGMLLLGVDSGMYTLISMFISAQVTDKVVEGFNRKKTLLIISNEYKDIASQVLREVHRGVTFIKAEGGYSKDSKKIMMVVVSLTQLSQIKEIIHTIDPKAFMIIIEAADVAGKGFSKIKI